MKILKRFLICIAVLLLVVWTVVLAVNLRVVHKGKAHVWNELSDTAYDAIVVLGAGLRPDGTPSDMLRDRLDGAIALYDAGASDTILLRAIARERIMTRWERWPHIVLLQRSRKPPWSVTERAIPRTKAWIAPYAYSAITISWW